jgi:hypothetical protein
VLSLQPPSGIAVRNPIAITTAGTSQILSSAQNGAVTHGTTAANGPKNSSRYRRSMKPIARARLNTSRRYVRHHRGWRPPHRGGPERSPPRAAARSRSASSTIVSVDVAPAAASGTRTTNRSTPTASMPMTSRCARSSIVPATASWSSDFASPTSTATSAGSSESGGSTR